MPGFFGDQDLVVWDFGYLRLVGSFDWLSHLRRRNESATADQQRRRLNLCYLRAQICRHQFVHRECHGRAAARVGWAAADTASATSVNTERGDRRFMFRRI